MAERMTASQPSERPGAVAVLIPIFNDHGRLAGTLQSLSGQRVPVVAVLVDDGSTAPVTVDGRRYDFEIVVLRHDANRGIEHALNTGLEYIRRREIEYVARLDNGDSCAPGRLAAQRALLASDPSIHLVGSAVEWRDDRGQVRFRRVFPTGHDAIVRALHHTTALIHPAVMFRASVLDTVGAYSTRFPAAEDYEFFFRIARRHRVANLPEILLVTRYDPNGVSMRRRRTQLRSTLRIQFSYFRPGVWASYYGVLKTLGRFLVPYSWITAAKAAAGRRSAAVPA
jgi:glycosyltransferase involved in cell wall biosynthesis